MEKLHVKITITGRVQGVGFRYNTLKVAQEYGITGFVQNKQDRNTVYIEAEGYPHQIDLFLEWCKKGTTWSRIDNVQTQYAPLVKHYGFVIK